MIAAWIFYALLVGALVGGSALVLDRLLRAHGLPSRWVWAGAMLLSSGLPLLHWFWKRAPREMPEMVIPFLPSMPIVMQPLSVEVAPQSFLHLLDAPIILVWSLASGLLVLFFTVLLIRTHRLRKRWQRGEAAGQRVLYSAEWGPAVVGFLRPQIVLPDWAHHLDEKALRLVLDHELEHVRAGDLRLILTTGVLPVLFPWHLPIWWQLIRLRLAVEGDCDLRVLHKSRGLTRPYVELLLDVGKRTLPRQPLAVLLSEPEQTLKRRIKIMTMPFPRKPWVRGILLTVFGAVLIGFACSAPAPTVADEEGVAESSLQMAEGALTPDTLFYRGYMDGVQTERWDAAIGAFEEALGLEPSEMMREQLNFWLGYSVLKAAIIEQDPQTVETAKAALPHFREALELFQNSGGYANEQDLEDTRQHLLNNIDIYIQIQEAIIRRGR